MAPRAELYRQRSDAGSLVGIGLNDDNGGIVRLVRGKLRPPEIAEAIGVASRQFSTAGLVAISSGHMYFAIDEFDETFFVEIKIPAGKYKVTVYQYLTSSGGDRLMRKPDNWAGFVQWHRRSHGKRRAPAWFAELARDSDLDNPMFDFDEDDLQLPVGLANDDVDEFVDFLIHMELTDECFDQTEIGDDGLVAMQSRLPSSPPKGIKPKKPYDIEDEAELRDEAIQLDDEAANTSKDPVHDSWQDWHIGMPFPQTVQWIAQRLCRGWFGHLKPADGGQEPQPINYWGELDDVFSSKEISQLLYEDGPPMAEKFDAQWDEQRKLWEQESAEWDYVYLNQDKATFSALAGGLKLIYRRAQFEFLLVSIPGKDPSDTFETLHEFAAMRAKKTVDVDRD